MAQSKIRFVEKDKEKKLFFRTLKRRVDQYFRENDVSPYANGEMIVKTVIMIGLYVVPFLAILLLNPPFGIAVALWGIMGLGIAGIGMCVMHDACHGAYSKHEWVNRLLGYSLNMVGGSTFNWRIQHNQLHHNYTNIVDEDEDVEDKLVLRFSPHTDVKKFHKFQWLYAFFFYGFLTLYWAVGKDFVQWIKYTRNGNNPHKGWANVKTFLRILVHKATYFFVTLVVPVLFVGIPLYQVLIGFMVMHFISGNILTLVFQLAHTVEGTEHPRADENGTIEDAWAVHQMKTTVNFARHNRFVNWCVGGLNFQVEHHLFPTICHVHYPKLAPIVKQTAEEYGIPYLENETFLEALRSHITTLERFGVPDLNEAIG